MDYLKSGLDPRAYNFADIDSCKAPLFRSHDCKAHGGGYEDIVGCMETSENVARMLQPCCLEPYNEAAKERVAFWTKAKDTEEGKKLMLETDALSAEMLRNVSTTY